MRRLISVAIKLASIRGVLKVLRVTGVLLGWEVKRFLGMRSRSDPISFAYGFLMNVLTLGDDWMGCREDWTSGTVIFLQVDGFHAWEVWWAGQSAK